MTSTRLIATFPSVAPYWLSLLTVPLAVLGAALGGWWVVALPLYAFGIFSILDHATGQNSDNPDPDIPASELFWYRAITILWVPVQFVTLFWIIWYAARVDHLEFWDTLGLLYGVGLMTGAIGIVYAHELLHQRNRLERWLGDLLLAMVLYSHFRTEHLLVHHVHVATPRDAVTARYNEGFHRFFFRVLRDCPRSAWNAEARRLEKVGRSRFDRSNPFWRYAALQLAMLALAALLGGWTGIGLFLGQAFVAIWMLELTDYVEHYGLTRRYLGGGRFEHVRPHHSWNASHRATNWLLINLQRHSDHHTKPDRRFPLLQTYSDEEAPQLPHGYPVMAALAMIPPVWRRMMNPRVRAWRRRHYPDITDWAPYKAGRHAG